VLSFWGVGKESAGFWLGRTVFASQKSGFSAYSVRRLGYYMIVRRCIDAGSPASCLSPWMRSVHGLGLAQESLLESLAGWWAPYLTFCCQQRRTCQSGIRQCTNLTSRHADRLLVRVFRQYRCAAVNFSGRPGVFCCHGCALRGRRGAFIVCCFPLFVTT
jgi:hypothetical protein